MGKKRRLRKLKPRFRRKTRPGASPGTIQVAPDAPRTSITAIAYDATRLVERTIQHPAELRHLLTQWPVVWVNVDGLGDADRLQQLADVFEIHRLALEDVVNVHQRSKLEKYPKSLYVVLRMPDRHGEHMTEQLSLFLGENFVVTFQERAGDCFGLVRDRLREQESTMRRELQADYLAYRLIDAAVDGFFPLLEELGRRLDRIDEETYSDPNRSSFEELHSIKREVLMLRRAFWPLRDMINELRSENTPFVTDSTRLYLRDCYDHAAQIIDLTESYRELCTDLRDFYLSSMSNRMNEVMKTLTMIATIFIPMSFITGLYGMNFDPSESRWNMPELNWDYGYPMALGIMAAIASCMLLVFWRRGWLGSSPPRRRRAAPRDSEPL